MPSTIEVGHGDARRFGGRRQVAGGGHRVARAEQVHQDQAQGQRQDRGDDEPAQRLDADAADFLGVAHLGDADHQGREHQRRDDHLDQAEEQGGHQRQRIGEARRVRQVVVREVADGDAKHQPHDDVSGQAVSIIHRASFW